MLARLQWILTLKCRLFVRLVSASLDRRLTLAERSAMAGHWLACPSCRRFRRQMHLIDALIRSVRARPTSHPPNEAIERIRQRVRREIRGEL